MKVVRFPNRRIALHTAEDDVADHAVETDPYDEEAAYHHGGGFDHADHDAERPDLTAQPLSSKRGQKRRRLSPAEILARSMAPAGRALGSRNMPAATPAEIIAQSLYPRGFAATQEMLRQSFWQVWLQHRDYLNKKSFHLLARHREDAEDALSATMMKALHNFVESAGDIDNTRAWLTTILHNACMDGHRSAKRRNDMIADTDISELENLPHKQGNQGRTPEDIVRIRQSLKILHQLILQLPQALREPLLMRTVEHLSYADIAQRLALTEANARKRVQQARDQLRSTRGYGSLVELFDVTPTEF